MRTKPKTKTHATFRVAVGELKKVRVFAIANVVLGVAVILLLVFLDRELLEEHLSLFFTVSIEMFVAVVFLVAQFVLIAGIVLQRYFKGKEHMNDLLEKEESDSLEFKSSLRWDYEQNKINKDLEHVILKTVVGFLNTDGGTLLIGVSDTKEVLGLENDYSTLRRKDADGFMQRVGTLIRNSLGNDVLVQYITISIVSHKQKDICRIDVEPSADPTFIEYKGKEEFYIRAVNMTVSLPVKQAYSYIKTRNPQR